MYPWSPSTTTIQGDIRYTTTRDHRARLLDAAARQITELLTPNHRLPLLFFTSICPQTVRMPKEAPTLLILMMRRRRVERATMREGALGCSLFQNMEDASLLFDIDNVGIQNITIPISMRRTRNTNNTRSCWPVRHLPAHHTRHVSSKTIPRRHQWKLPSTPSSRHSATRIITRSCISSTYTSTAPLYMHTRTCTHLQPSSPASNLPAFCRTALPHAPKQATPDSPNTHPLAHNRQR